jgi:hypothetical protein
MTTLLTGLNTTNRACLASINGRVYLANDFDPLKVMTPDAGYNASIAGPAGSLGAPTATAGNVTNGTHLVRYRYRDSRTGYVSNPSGAVSVTVSGGNGTLTFDVTTDYTASTDSKVTNIDIELTPVNDSTFYRAQTALNTATAIAVSITDANLTQQVNADALYGSAETFDLDRNGVVPTRSVIVAHRNRLFFGVDTPYAITASFSSGSAAVQYVGAPAAWSGRLIQASGDTVNYEISSVASATLTLSAVYAGTTGDKTATVYSKFPNRIGYSALNFPEGTLLGTYERDVLLGRGDRLKAMFSQEDALYLLGLYSTDRLVFNTDPSALTSNLLPVKGNRGAFNQRVLIAAEGRLFSWDRLGMYEAGPMPRHISNHIDPTLAEICDYTANVKFHGVYDPIERVLAWFFCISGETWPTFAAVVELDSVDTDPRWQFYEYRQGIVSSTIVASSDGQVRGWLGDENGYTWAFSTTNTFDGVYPTNPGVVTVAAGATTTVLPVDEALYTTVTLGGAIAYLPSTGEERVVSTNTASTITLASALANAPADGTEVWLGSFPVEYRTKWWAGQGMQNKKKPSYFYLMLYPGTATGKLQVYFYKDFSSQPYTFPEAATDASYIGWDGVTFVGGVLTVDLDAGSGDGFVSVNMPSDQWRVMQARVVSTKPDGTLRILDMGFRVLKGEEVEVGNE